MARENRNDLRINPSVRNLNFSGYGKTTKKENSLDCYLGTNPHAPVPSVRKALDERNNLDFQVQDYSHESSHELTTLIEDKWREEAGLEISDVLRLGNGAKTTLENFNKMCLFPGDTCVGFAPQYTNYVRMVKYSGSKFDAVPLKESENFRLRPDKLIEKIKRSKPSLVYIDNPNNPTGQFISLDQMRSIVESAEDNGTIVVVDEAYASFLDRSKSAVNLIPEFDNLGVARSFSKGHGLAGLRIGYTAISEDLVKFYDRVDVSYKVSKIAMDMAKISLNSEDYLNRSYELIKQTKSKIIDRTKYESMDTSSKVPIFVMKDPENGNLYSKLMEKGVYTNPGQNFTGLDERFVRFRVPEKPEKFIRRVRKE